MSEKLKFKKTRKVKNPTRGTQFSAGVDFYVPEDLDPGFGSKIGPGDDILIPSGIKASIPQNTALVAFNKSGVAVKKGFSVGACVIDSDYQGEIYIHLYNRTNKYLDAPKPGEKIIQFLLLPVLLADIEMYESELFTETTERGAGGFGSTGIY